MTANPSDAKKNGTSRLSVSVRNDGASVFPAAVECA
jgi:hypothetical protein